MSHSLPPLAKDGVLRDVVIANTARLLLRPAAQTIANAGNNGSSGQEPNRAKVSGVPINSADSNAPSTPSKLVPANSEDDLPPTRDQDALTAAAFRQGYDQGFEKGLADGATKAEQEVKLAGQKALTLRIEYLDKLLAAVGQSLNDGVAERIASVDEDMLALCHAAICKILGETALKPDMIAQSIQSAIAAYSGERVGQESSERLTIHVHPHDFAFLQSGAGMADWLARQKAPAIEWLADEKVRLGGCIIVSKGGRFDARLETQINALHAHLLKCRSAAPVLAAANTGTDANTDTNTKEAT